MWYTLIEIFSYSHLDRCTIRDYRSLHLSIPHCRPAAAAAAAYDNTEEYTSSQSVSPTSLTH